tara:strand:+ start:8767 stop:9009 length:243 start_codon:yes stop_codon:yes gene_type:complete
LSEQKGETLEQIRFEHIILSSDGKGLSPFLGIIEGGHDHYAWQVRALAVTDEFSEAFEAIHTREHQVQQNQVESVMVHNV